MLQALLSECRFNVEDTVLVGDTEFDMEMARRIAMPRIAVDYGAHPIARLKVYDPVLCVNHFPQLQTFRLPSWPLAANPEPELRSGPLPRVGD